ncbi:flagella basal body P-ring formation protein FlgA [Desulfonatronum thiosulfatophilum]|uniref:Flagella basal body P-ring formation protein FlgA n=1 Tax=Desulfonatronum thiosulfatophilum TaxID=617002 RepID=A0A1G6DJE3_9BACT|nr:flagellar basal body P-ring formation chaperone FlgA [Desulfonatronum thiosulfatophilum]SDB44945.1 flagella basal body P-ring formation protein FlgA [Desulfonatronum thiosulfatophilum]
MNKTVRLMRSCFCNLHFIVAWSVLILFFLFAVNPADAQRGYWHYLVHPVAAVEGDIVRFGDIAVPLTDHGRSQWAKLSEQPMWPAPEPGKTMSFSQERLAGLLRQHIGHAAASARLPSQFVLQGGGQVFLEEEIRSRVVTFLTPKTSNLGEEVSFRDFRLPGHIFLPHAQDALEIEPAAELRPGRNSLRFLIRSVDGRISRRITGTVFLDVWQTVPCATRPMNRGTPLDLDEITFHRKNLAYLRDQVWDGTGGPWQIRTPVGMDQVIYLSALEPLPAIRRGDHVNLLYEGELVRLQIQVQALQDGAIGETIAVRNLQNNNEVLARIRDFETVVVR